jgi:hypothetical protein
LIDGIVMDPDGQLIRGWPPGTQGFRVALRANSREFVYADGGGGRLLSGATLNDHGHATIGDDGNSITRDLHKRRMS